MSAPAVIFDLDGTLVDTAPDLVATLNTVLARIGLPPVPYAAARNMVGGGARAMIERGLQAERRTVTPGEVDGLVNDFIAHYAAHIADQSRPFPGLVAALDVLGREGYRLAVCTNKLEWLAVRLLEALRLKPRFVAICGGDTFGITKPDAELLRRTITQAGGQIERAVLVGDSATDISTARNAGVPVIAVDFGYSEVPIAQYQPDRLISAFEELPAAVFATVPPAEQPSRR
ncbi:MAG: phosphoglycolate phosphatase [Xanthobacteraceae bacterium]